jgi:HSP20 family protein
VAERRDIERLSSEIEELFSELWQVPRFARMRQGFRPQVDCYRSDDPPGFTVVLELAGVDPADVTVEAVGGSLVVSGERRRERAAGRHYEVMELEYGPFRRQIPLPGDIDVAQARATYERGLLTIVLPAAPQPTQPAAVTIEVTLRP